MISSEWEAEFKRAQAVTQLVINSRELERVRYGEEETVRDLPKCEDCSAPKGSLHLFGCDLEECPRCGGQIITCDCFFEERPGEPPLV